MNSKTYVPTARDFPSSNFRRVVDGILNLFYPDSCLVCSAAISRMQDCGVCFRCWEKTLQLQLLKPWCPSCGIPFQSGNVEDGHLCGECILEAPPFSASRSFGYYRAELSKLIQGLKFQGRKNLTGLLSPLLARAFLETWSREEFDLVIPVPLHPKRKQERGFNQAVLLSRALAPLIALPTCEKAIQRCRNTDPQVGLSNADRLRNVSHAFVCRHPQLVARKRLLLVDDVMTTGATVRSACNALLAAGASGVSVLTVARAVPGLE